jgi:hypothetical protein
MFIAQISALHKLRAVQSWQSTIQVIGPPEQKIMAPLMLRNLKRISWIIPNAGVANLGAPTSIAVCCETMVVAVFIGDHIVVRLCV